MNGRLEACFESVFFCRMPKPTILALSFVESRCDDPRRSCYHVLSSCWDCGLCAAWPGDVGNQEDAGSNFADRCLGTVWLLWVTTVSVRFMQFSICSLKNNFAALGALQHSVSQELK